MSGEIVSKKRVEDMTWFGRPLKDLETDELYDVIEFLAERVEWK